MDKGRFQVIFDRLNKSVVHTETMTATIRVERLSELQEIEDRIDPEVWDRQILNGRAGISPEMAVRLSIAFKTSAESWLNQQVQYDLWRAEKLRKSLRVTGLAA